MVTIQLTAEQLRYLRDAVRRDAENLEEMAPWEIDDQGEEHKRECQLCKSMDKLLAKVEQEQAIPF